MARRPAPFDLPEPDLGDALGGGYKGRRPCPIPDLPTTGGRPGTNTDLVPANPFSAARGLSYGDTWGNNPLSPLTIPVQGESPTGFRDKLKDSLSPVLLAERESDVMLVVRNTFIEEKKPKRILKMSRSDSELSSPSDPESPLYPACAGDSLYDTPYESVGGPSNQHRLAFQPASPAARVEPILPPRAVQTYQATSVQSVAPLQDLAESPDGEPPSIGSIGHFEETCHPCCFFRRARCTLGKDCQHCHYKHEIKNHPGKKTRDRARAKAQRDAAKDGEQAA